MSDQKLLWWVGGIAVVLLTAILVFLPRFLTSGGAADRAPISVAQKPPGVSATKPASKPAMNSPRETPLKVAAPQPDPTSRVDMAPKAPRYRVHSEKVTDIFAKALAEIIVVVPQDSTADEIRSALRAEFQRGAALPTNGEYHNRVTQVVVRAYTSVQAAMSQRGTQIGMIIGEPPNIPEAYVEENILKAQQQPHIVKFGRTEAERRAIWEQMAALEDKAKQEADRLFPIHGVPSTAQSNANLDARNRITVQYQKELAAKHGLTDDERTEILVEGFQKGWSPAQ